MDAIQRLLTAGNDCCDPAASSAIRVLHLETFYRNLLRVTVCYRTRPVPVTRLTVLNARPLQEPTTRGLQCQALSIMMNHETNEKNRRREL